MFPIFVVILVFAAVPAGYPQDSMKGFSELSVCWSTEDWSWVVRMPTAGLHIFSHLYYLDLTRDVAKFNTTFLLKAMESWQNRNWQVPGQLRHPAELTSMSQSVHLPDHLELDFTPAVKSYCLRYSQTIAKFSFAYIHCMVRSTEISVH